MLQQELRRSSLTPNKAQSVRLHWRSVAEGQGREADGGPQSERLYHRPQRVEQSPDGTEYTISWGQFPALADCDISL